MRQEDLSEQKILLELCRGRSEKGRKDLKTPLQRVKDPTGRIDWLLASLLDRVIEKKRDPVLSRVYSQLKAPVEQLLRAKLGPRNKEMRKLRKYITEGQKMLAEAQRRRMA